MTGALYVDNFAGGGGASLGMEWALRRPVSIAVNHDENAILMHRANHPATRHYCENVWHVDPREACAGQPVDIAWFSPDCRDFSKAKGSRPKRDKAVRGLAWVVLRWAGLVRPNLIFLENVEEFKGWGPLTRSGRRAKDKAGLTFDRWVAQLRALGYAVDWRELRACDYGAPTIRKRLFIIARRDGKPIIWPEPTHGPGRPLPWRTAASHVIDWSIPCPSIFDRPRPLAEATLRRIARGIRKFVIEAESPFIIPITHHGDARVHGIHEPLRTVTAAHRGELALIAPTLVQTGYGERPGQAPRAPGLHKPLGTVVAGGAKHALVTAFLAKHFGGVTGCAADVPVPTITTRGTQTQLVTSHLMKLRGTCAHGQAATEPLHTVSAGGTHFAEVRAFLMKYYGTGGQLAGVDEPMHTLTAKARMGLVTVAGDDYAIADIGMRMLTPRELFRAQGFPDDYDIDCVVDGKPLTKTEQIHKCGNSVSPWMAAALIKANYALAGGYTDHAGNWMRAAAARAEGGAR